MVVRRGPDNGFTRRYWKDSWNKFDFLIVLTSLPGLLGLMGNGTGVFRIFRIARLFKLVQGAKGLRTLFNTLLQSLPAIGNVGSLLFLLMFVYGVLGMNMYGKPGTVLYDAQHANFNDFATSLNTLFRVFTGDSWSAIMKEAFECTDHGGCANHERGRTLDGAIAAIYFISFVVAGSFVMLNLIIAVILDKFMDSAESEGLLQADNFFDVLRKKMIIDKFMDKLEWKLKEHMAKLKLEKKLSKKKK